MKLNEFKKVLRELLIEVLAEKINSRDMPNGSTWHTAGKGWGAKNKHGVTNYWYGPDAVSNKKNAEEFARHNENKPKEKEPQTSNTYSAHN